MLARSGAAAVPFAGATSWGPRWAGGRSPEGSGSRQRRRRFWFAGAGAAGGSVKAGASEPRDGLSRRSAQTEVPGGSGAGLERGGALQRAGPRLRAGA